MSTLVYAEHDNSSLNSATLNTVAAAEALGGDIDILVAGEHCAGAAAAAQAVAGVGRVLCADAAAYGPRRPMSSGVLPVPLSLPPSISTGLTQCQEIYTSDRCRF